MGDVTGEFEMSIIGSGGKQYGVMLYAERGAIRRMNDLVAAGRDHEARRLDFLSISLDPGPGYAIRALEHAFGLGDVPTPMKIRAGRPVPATELDLVVLAAVLWATSALSPSKLEGSSFLRAAGKAIAATVRAPPSERDPAVLREIFE